MKRLLILFYLLLISLLVMSCSSNWTKKNGSFAKDDDIKTMFENYEYDTKYNYYYTVSAYNDYPEAIVGIEKDYELVKVSGWVSVTDWQQFEPDSEKLKELIGEMYTPTSHGYIIYGPDVDQIGIMYAMKPGSDMPEIRFKDGNLIVVRPRTFTLSGSGAP